MDAPKPDDRLNQLAKIDCVLPWNRTVPLRRIE
jgi:hypothetical protein